MASMVRGFSHAALGKERWCMSIMSHWALFALMPIPCWRPQFFKLKIASQAGVLMNTAGAQAQAFRPALRRKYPSTAPDEEPSK